ncbi:Chaperone protein [Wickerhamomyces ciferrii]|uniref:Chaperone protein n=1 Tax=Wickerhamomyces ciferrii (strain ATCC 14091 / BCRC 22168 / CBS 111 / JCM 3599 / NBRC 0793 / NRRL Y-1031 F-60-10) TaxID=1206466 RepID=K0KIY6_WICCF|nr:Chaperone protein [Wickerhamomyces ciferrii]CCH45185.1 Chaperone protein [Wickerhamomyces ciferrii]
MEESELKRQELDLKRDNEINRIITTFKLDPYAILQLDHDTNYTAIEIKKVYRSKSLLIHPDKTSNPDASKAFDLLKKAESDISNEEIKTKLNTIWSKAKEDIEPIHKSNNKEIYNLFKDLLIQEEFQKRIKVKQDLQKQGELDRLKEEELELNKLKTEYKKQWEANQDSRVKNWRSYANKVEKKKKKSSNGKKKTKVLA